jgi:uncharacterized protein (TIGR03067 family)
MSKLTFSLTAFAVVLAGTHALSGQKDGGGLSAKKLAGTYELISGEKDGKPIPKDELHAAAIRFSADTITAIDKEDKNVYVAKYKLRDQPRGRITMVSVEPEKDMVAEGLVKLEG